MKLSKGVIGVLSVVAMNVAFASMAFAAEERVIEETLIYKDPTVAGAGKWIFGGSVEGMYTFGKASGYDLNGNPASGTISATKPGVNIFVGYGDFTLNYAYKSGTNNWTFPNVNTSEKLTNNELIGRWIFSGVTDLFTPYVYAGYYTMNKNQTDTIVNSALVWTATLTPVLTSTSKFTGTMLGIGGIVPVSDKWGVRLDGGVINNKVTTTGAGLTSSSRTGNGGRVTGTVYYNFDRNWNAQFGGRYEVYGGGTGEKIGGVFGMLGYTFK